MRWLDGITDSMDVNLSKLRDGEGQKNLACCSPWGHKESDMNERLNTTTLVYSGQLGQVYKCKTL